MEDVVQQVPDIDFLPAAYREQGEKRNISLWRLLLVGLFGAVPVLCTWQQVRLKHEAESQLANVESLHAAARARNDHLARLQADMAPAAAHGALLTYLRHPWPRTQILQAIAEPLPDDVVLAELQLAREALPQKHLEAARPVAPGAPPAAAPTNNAAADLETLRTEVDGTRLVISLTGITQEVGTLHEYLGRLSTNKLFQKVELGSIEGTSSQERRGLRFTARIVIRPGYGTTGGPARPEGAVAARTESETNASQN